MFCRKCGAEQSEDNRFCDKCGEAILPPVREEATGNAGPAEATASEPRVGAEATIVSVKKSPLKIIAAVMFAVIVLIFVIRAYGIDNVVADVKNMDVDEGATTTLGEAVKQAIPNAKWSSEKNPDGSYTVIISGFWPDQYANVEIAYRVNYSGDWVYRKISYVVWNGEFSSTASDVNYVWDLLADYQ